MLKGPIQRRIGVGGGDRQTRAVESAMREQQQQA